MKIKQIFKPKVIDEVCTGSLGPAKPPDMEHLQFYSCHSEHNCASQNLIVISHAVRKFSHSRARIY